MKQKGLGKGLGALFSEEVLNAQEESVQYIDINKIDPNNEQPRKKFTDQELNELSLSIKEHGILQPLLVRLQEDRYQIVAGERRYRAARIAQMKEVPVLVKELSDKQTLEISIVENIQREDLNCIELAYAYSLLMKQFDYTQEEIAEKLGKARSSITNILRLLTLTDYVQGKLRDDELSLGHAKVLMGIKESKQQEALMDLAIDKKMSVRELEDYIKQMDHKKDKNNVDDKESTIEAPFYREIQDHLQHMLGTKVVISKGKKKGKIEIEYYSNDELERIIDIIKK